MHLKWVQSTLTSSTKKRNGMKCTTWIVHACTVSKQGHRSTQQGRLHNLLFRAYTVSDNLDILRGTPIQMGGQMPSRQRKKLMNLLVCGFTGSRANQMYVHCMEFGFMRRAGVCWAAARTLHWLLVWAGAWPG